MTTPAARMPNFPTIPGPTPEQAAAIRAAIACASQALDVLGEQLAQGYADFARELNARADARGARQWGRIL